MKTHPLISLWSGPRNVSTALMYSFGERQDMIIVDEPLYAYYLQKTGVEHPGRQEVLSSMSADPAEIWSAISREPGKYTFIKNMAHHAIDLPVEWYEQTTPLLLIRDPYEMLPSLSIQLPNATLRDTGLKRQWELLTEMKDKGKKVVVVDSGILLKNPARILAKICESLDIPFDRHMLSWNPGARAADGVWAKYWYHSVHKSTGFQPYVKKTGPFPERLKPLLLECNYYYNRLFELALT